MAAMPSISRVAAVLVTLSALATTGCGLQQSLAQRSDAPSVNPTQAPAITAQTLDNTAFNWAAVRGHVLVIDFWASWCGPCRAEQAELNQLQAHYAPAGVMFLGVDVRDDKATANAYRHDLAVLYASVVDPDELISAAYDVAAPPTLIVVDAHGNIVDRLLGTVSGLSADLDRLH
jgi:thiol-disulfide isomerase/thioredoxin